MQENRELSLNTRPQVPSLPLAGSAVLNDRPVACQIREPTDPQGDRWRGEAVTDIVSRSRARERVSDGPISSNSGRNGGKNAGRNCVSALPQRATPVRCRPRFPSRNRRFPDRCRSPDCASTAFRCRCLLLRKKLFVLLRRRLLYPVPNGHTYPLRCSAPQWARFDNRQKRPAYQPLPSLYQRQRRRRYKQSPEPTTSPTAPIPRDQHRQICTYPPRAKGP